MSYAGITNVPFVNFYPSNVYNDNRDESGIAPPPPPANGFLLLETGFYLLLETGGRIILEVEVMQNNFLLETGADLLLENDFNFLLE